MPADLTFGPLLTPEGGNEGPIVIDKPFPKASEGFNIQWADLNAGNEWSAPYIDRVWITDENNNNVTVWWREFQNQQLGPGQSRPQVYPVRPYEIARGRYTFHVWINVWAYNNYAPEWNWGNNYTYYANVDVGQ